MWGCAERLCSFSLTQNGSMVEPRMLISRESLMTSSVWELAAWMQHREREEETEGERERGKRESENQPHTVNSITGHA